jgi:hypothetical protein
VRARCIFMGRILVAGSSHMLELLHVLGAVLLALALLAGASLSVSLADHAPLVIALWALAILAFIALDGAYIEWHKVADASRGTLWRTEIGGVSATATVPSGYAVSATARGDAVTVRVYPHTGGTATRRTDSTGAGR